VSVHTFAAVLDGRHRRCDVGLLYDPSRELEAAFCSEWQARLVEAVPGLVVRRNYPYRGIADGLVTWLRRRLPANDYLGIELELNQALSVRRGAAWRRLLDALAVTLPVDWLSGHRGAGAVRGRGRRRPAGRPR
jgi:predicted N-formylglutamate amidohydrolase